MAIRNTLPQMRGQEMVCGGGIETWLQYKDGFELRHFCLFELLDDKRGIARLRDFQKKYVEAAVNNGFGVINEGLHYRASRDWGELIGYSREGLEEINIRGVEFYKDFVREYDSPETPMIVAGAIGPRGDAYKVGLSHNAAESEDYHSEQILTLKKAGVDQITAMTFSSVEEAIGITHAAEAADLPIVISLFVNQGGLLSGGETLEDAISKIDLGTRSAPAYYMVNCTHPTEFEPALIPGDWARRLGGFMPNAVAMETLALCKLGHLEDGDPEELGRQMADLARRFTHIHVWGGCCGTDGRHIGEIARQVGVIRQVTAPQ